MIRKAAMDNQVAIVNGRIYTGEAILADQAILIEGNRIEAILHPSELPENVRIVDAGGGVVAPGLIDLQIYGAGGHLFAADTRTDTLRAIGDCIVASGTTGFMLTLATNTPAVYQSALSCVKQEAHPALLGLHFEGPYLNPEKRGAHPPAYLRKPDYQEIEQTLQFAEGWLKMMTIAPELFDEKCINLLLDHGVLLSAGHSNATAQQAMQGFTSGVKAVTHLFNGMSPLHHREPGLPGATFLSNHAQAGIIADGIHVDYQVLEISKRILGDRLFLITDAIAAASNGVYDYIFKGDRFTLADGTLSGTSLSQLESVANCVRFANISLDEALRMASLYPARLAGIDNAGKIAVGFLANIIVFDADFNLRHVFHLGSELPSRERRVDSG